MASRPKKKKKGAGRKERAGTVVGARRIPDVEDAYKASLAPLTLGAFDFRTTLLRGPGTKSLRLDPVVTSIEWSEEAREGDNTSGLTGSIVLQRPDPGDPSSLPIGRAHQVKLEVRTAGKFQDVFTMRVDPPELDLPGSVNAALTDSLDAVSRGKRKWSVRAKGNARIRAHEAVQKMAPEAGIRLGRVAEGTVRMRRVETTGNFLDFVKKAYELDSDRTGLLVIPRFVGGRLSILPYARNSVLYNLKDQLQEALLSEEAAVRPVTAIHGHARIGKNKGAKTRQYVVARPEIIARFGYIRSDRDYGRLDSYDDLVERVKRSYAYGLRVRRTATLTIPCIPFLRFGDAAFLDLPREGFKDKEAFVFVNSVSHSVTAAGQTTRLEVVATDPFKKYQQERDAKLREKKGRARRSRRRRR